VEQAKLLEISFDLSLVEYEHPKIQKNPFSQNFFGKVKNGHKKVCPKFEIAKKFPKKNFFFIITN
jgi:hypothetical protein